jgi:hypothetical protein
MTAQRRTAVGDLLTTLHGLRIDDRATAAMAARMLGLAVAVAAPQVGDEPAADGGRAIAATEGLEQTSPSRAGATAPSNVEESRADTRRAHPANPPDPEPELGPAPATRPRTWRTIAPRLPDRNLGASLTVASPATFPAADSRLGATGVAGLVTPSRAQRYVTPWRARWAPGIAFVVTATMSVARRVDLAAALRLVTRGRPIQRFPRRRRLTTRRGVQVLVDHGDSMRPFSADRVWLVTLVLRVAGNPTQVLRFRSTPWTGVASGTPFRIAAYDPPKAGVPVVVISDLGLLSAPFHSYGTEQEWRRFLSALSRHNPVTVITPFGPEDYPAALRDQVTIVGLEDRTSIQHVRRINHRLHRSRA